MSIQQPAPQVPGAANSPPGKSFIFSYLEALSLVERLHRLLLDVIKDEFERVGVLEINAVQALLLFNIGDNEKKLVEMGYMHHQRCEIDRRSVRVRLTENGRMIRTTVSDLFERHAEGLQAANVLQADGIDDITGTLKRYWTDQIRYIY